MTKNNVSYCNQHQTQIILEILDYIDFIEYVYLIQMRSVNHGYCAYVSKIQDCVSYPYMVLAGDFRKDSCLHIDIYFLSRSFSIQLLTIVLF